MRGIFNRMYVNIYGKSGIVDEGLYGQRFEVIEGCAGATGACLKVRTDYGYEGCVKGCDVIMDDCAAPYHEAAGQGECNLVQVVKAVADIMSEPAAASVRLMSVTRGAIIMCCAATEEPDSQALLCTGEKNGYVCVRLYDGRTGYIKRSYIEEYVKPIGADKLSELTEVEKTVLRERLVNTAMSYLGTQYRWGGKTPLGIDCSGLTSMSYMLNGVYIYRPPVFRGDFLRPSRVLDYRIYLPRLMGEYEQRGGTIEQRAVEPGDFEQLARRHDLVVVAAGKRSFAEYFGERPEISPYSAPQRHLAVGFWDGVEQTEPRAVTMSISPGHGELLDLPITTFDGFASALLCENVPGGDLEVLMAQRESDDPEAYRKLTLAKLAEHHPTVRARIDESKFRLMRPGDILQGAVRPVVREDYRLLDDGTVVLALGDAHATVDPVTGQGANSASFEAQVAADAIIEDGVVDERFAQKVALRRRERVDGLSTWVNTMIATPTPPHLQKLLGAMSGMRTLCDEFTENFSHPHRNGDMVATPERVDAAIARHSALGG